jgi:hypothetical protein
MTSVTDAELVAAGNEFRILRARFIEGRRLAASLARISRQYSDVTWPRPVVGKPGCAGADQPNCSDITDAMDPIINRILALPATTIDGLNAKAEVVRHCYEKGFNDEFDADAPWDDLGTVRALVEAVSSMANRTIEIRAA